jgi:hypothetical protein
MWSNWPDWYRLKFGTLFILFLMITFFLLSIMLFDIVWPKGVTIFNWLKNLFRSQVNVEPRTFAVVQPLILFDGEIGLQLFYSLQNLGMILQARLKFLTSVQKFDSFAPAFIRCKEKIKVLNERTCLLKTESSFLRSG